MFKLTIKTDNAAFRDDDSDGDHQAAAMLECARILREVANRLECGSCSESLRDYNGNKVGDFILELDD